MVLIFRMKVSKKQVASTWLRKPDRLGYAIRIIRPWAEVQQAGGKRKAGPAASCNWFMGRCKYRGAGTYIEGKMSGNYHLDSRDGWGQKKWPSQLWQESIFMKEIQDKINPLSLTLSYLSIINISLLHIYQMWLNGLNFLI